MRCIGDVIQELLAAHENGRDVNLVIWHLKLRTVVILYVAAYLYVLLSYSQAGPGRSLSQPRTKTFSALST